MAFGGAGKAEPVTVTNSLFRKSCPFLLESNCITPYSSVLYSSYGNEMWEFAPDGRMARRQASINDLKLNDESERCIFPRGPGE
jgi:Protein of unknown function (DUF1348)